jgi:trk system potassium uptake protein TrkH
MELSGLSKEGYRYKSSKVVWIITMVYLGLTVTSCLALWLAGMPFFDAVNHAFSIAATGGFSSRNLSIAAFDSRLIDFVALVFMAVAAIHFGLLYAVVATRSLKPLNNSVVKYYFGSILVMTVIIAFALMTQGSYDSWGRAILDASFNVVSYMSTTGFANCNNADWPWLAAIVLIFLSFHCGCSGSTTGGVKIDRLLITFKAMWAEVRRRIHPTSVRQVHLGGHLLPDSTIGSAMIYIVIYVLVIFFSIFAVMLCGTEATDAVSGVIASVGSVGPGVGDLGSLDNYSSQLPAAKLIFTFDMFLGRLEIYPVLVVFSMIFRRDV